MELVRIDRYAGVDVVTLNDPARRNAITPRLADELAEALTALAADDAARAMVITGDGPAFCAGADRGALRKADEPLLRRIYSAFLTVRDLPMPTVAAVNGPAVGAGLNLALACDVRIAGHSAVFDSRFVTIPIHPGGGHTWMLSHAIGPQATAAMTLFGQPVDGQRAAEIGLAWTCVPDAELRATSVEFCARVVAAPPPLVREIKDTLRAAAPGHGDATEVELRRQLASIQRPEYRNRFGAKR